MKSNLEQLRKMTDQLSELESLLAAFFTLSPDLFAVMKWEVGQNNEEVRFSAVNQAWTEILGWSHAEMTQESYRDKIHPKDRNEAEAEAIPEYTQFELEAAAEKARSEGVNFDPNRRVQLVAYVQRWLHKDGSTRTISWNGNFDFEKRICYIVGRDITGSIDDFEAIRRYRHNLRNIAEDYLTDAIGMMELSRDRIREVEKALNQYDPPKAST